MRSRYSAGVQGLTPWARRAISCSTRASASCSKSASGRGSTAVAMSGHLPEGAVAVVGGGCCGGGGELVEGGLRRLAQGDRHPSEEEEAATVVDLELDVVRVVAESERLVEEVRRLAAHRGVSLRAVRRACFLRDAADDRRGRPVGLRPTRGSGAAGGFCCSLTGHPLRRGR